MLIESYIIGNRSFFPLQLYKLNNILSDKEYDSLEDVAAADLPNEIKAEIKYITRELADFLETKLGIDISESIYSLGKTSTLMGFYLQQELEPTTASKSGSNEKPHELYDWIQLLPPTDKSQTNVLSKSSKQSASLIIIDRNEDLYTPTSHSGNHSLAHRIINTLRRGPNHHQTDNLCQLHIQSSTHKLFSTSNSTTHRNPYNHLMSGCSSLAFQTNPNLLFNYDCEGYQMFLTPSQYASLTQNESELHRIVLSQGEEKGRQVLSKVLKDRILLEGGSMEEDSKKKKSRGAGTEVLALTNQLVQCSGMKIPTEPGHHDEVEMNIWNPYPSVFNADFIRTHRFSPNTCLRSHELLSISYAVIEAMQRSSSKQFPTICQWQCSFDVRAAREMELESLIAQHEDFEICIAHLHSYLLKHPPKKEDLSPSSKKGRPEANDKTSLKTSSSQPKGLDGPVDIMFLLLQVIRLIEIFRYQIMKGTNPLNTSTKKSKKEIENLVRKQLTSQLWLFKQGVIDFMMHHSEMDELTYLHHVGIIQNADVQTVEYYRRLRDTMDGLLTKDLVMMDEKKERLETTIGDIELLVNELKAKIIGSVEDVFQIIMDVISWCSMKRLDSIFSSDLKSDPLNNSLEMLPQISHLQSSKSETTEELIGLIGQVVKEHLYYMNPSLMPLLSNNKATPLLRALTYIESPIEQMKRMGLGLLSKGLGSFGFSNIATAIDKNSIPHPSRDDRNCMIIFVVGGISFKEIYQVQSVMDEWDKQPSIFKGNQSKRIILISNQIVTTESILTSLL